MTPEQLRQVEQIVSALLLVPPDQCAAELDQLCPSDAQVRARVLELLAHASTDSQAGEVSAMLRPLRDRVNESRKDLLPNGSLFEGYEILDFLGQGGNGRVYKARETSGSRHTVALKIIVPKSMDPQYVSRFLQETLILAKLDHPNIARFCRAGKSVDGLLYFAMEFVPGEPITKRADQQRLSIRDRLRWFLQVCDAMSYSHIKLAVHRDIKPKNVLAYFSDKGQWVIKVIDFGIAKSLAGDGLSNTQHGMAHGSPESISPEQARGNSDIDTLTDVYSLGTLLYELLVGAKAFDPARFNNMYEACKAIIEEDPPLPSKRLMDSSDAAGVAANRSTRLDNLAQELRRELEWIICKAMHKDRSQRYSSVSELATDVRNYLDSKPVKARPNPFMYVAKKWYQRNRVLAVSAAALVAMVTSSVVLYIRGIRAEQMKTQAALDDFKRQKAATDEERRQRADSILMAAESLSRASRQATRNVVLNNVEAWRDDSRVRYAAEMLWQDVVQNRRAGFGRPLTADEKNEFFFELPFDLTGGFPPGQPLHELGKSRDKTVVDTVREFQNQTRMPDDAQPATLDQNQR